MNSTLKIGDLVEFIETENINHDFWGFVVKVIGDPKNGSVKAKAFRTLEGYSRWCSEEWDVSIRNLKKVVPEPKRNSL